MVNFVLKTYNNEILTLTKYFQRLKVNHAFINMPLL